MGFDHIRVGHAGALFHPHPKRAVADPSCAKGGFYKSPTVGQTVDSLKPLNITWDTTCLNASAVDIYLYAPGSNRSRIHVWQGVEFYKGSYTANIKPRWWNSTASMMLQLTIIDSGVPPFLSTLRAGPVFTATYTAPAGAVPPDADPSQTDNGVTQVNNLASNTHKSIAPGKTAAAVIMPLLIVALVIGLYIKMVRARGIEKRKRWSEALDKRMSTISTDWKSMSGAGANAAIRNSMAISNSANRSSAFSFGAIRPSSTYTVEGGQAGIGAARGMYSQSNTSIDTTASRQMSQVRPGARTSALGERVSRVSFAADARPSGESRRLANGTSRAFHSAYIPPLPTRQDSQSDMDDGTGSGAMSPTQTQGPLNLTSEDIRDRISGNSQSTNAGIDEVMPALSMMRTGSNDSHSPNPENDDLLFAPAPPSPSHVKAPKSPLGMMPMQPMPANVMSPDDMLRAYAERRPTTPATNSFNPGITYPSPTANNFNGNGMRTLYSPTTPSTASPMIAAGPGAALEDSRKSFAPTYGSTYSIGTDDDDGQYAHYEQAYGHGVYNGTAE
jgi:hypothetical protein